MERGAARSPLHTCVLLDWRVHGMERHECARWAGGTCQIFPAGLATGPFERDALLRELAARRACEDEDTRERQVMPTLSKRVCTSAIAATVAQELIWPQGGQKKCLHSPVALPRVPQAVSRCMHVPASARAATSTSTAVMRKSFMATASRTCCVVREEEEHVL